MVVGFLDQPVILEAEVQSASAVSAQEMDRLAALACLCGRHNRFLIKHNAVSLGRATDASQVTLENPPLLANPNSQKSGYNLGFCNQDSNLLWRSSAAEKLEEAQMSYWPEPFRLFFSTALLQPVSCLDLNRALSCQKKFKYHLA